MALSDGMEVAIQRMNTDYFIGADPMRVELVRPVKVSNGHGGFVEGAPLVLPEQKLKLIPQNRHVDARQVAEGAVALPSYVLMGYWDADVQAGDYFVYLGQRYDVTLVHPKRDYETIAEVSFRG